MGKGPDVREILDEDQESGDIGRGPKTVYEMHINTQL
jgi:hypothetical protein